MPSSRFRPVKSLILRQLLIIIGWLSIVLGTLGIFLPLLPTTPFLLLAAACFVRSSEPFYRWLVEHPQLGRFLLNYLDGKGIPAKVRIYALVLLWCSLGLSAYLVPHLGLQLLLLVIGCGVSTYLIRLKTLEPEMKIETEQTRGEA